MKRIRDLDRYQKGILLLLLAMMLVFAVIYAVSASRVGFLFENHIFLPSQVDGNMVYSATIGGVDSSFTVTPDKAVVFQYGDKIYGPYTAKEDATAIPKENAFSSYMKGIEIRRGEDIFFRGGVYESGGSNPCRMIYREDGTNVNSTVEVVKLDAFGKEIKKIEPSVFTILDLVEGPELTSKGEWGFWLWAVVVSIVTAISILFADELFRWGMMFRIQDAEHAEPSDWELAGRYIGWTVLPVLVLIVYIMGLR